MKTDHRQTLKTPNRIKSLPISNSLPRLQGGYRGEGYTHTHTQKHTHKNAIYIEYILRAFVLQFLTVTFPVCMIWVDLLAENDH